LIISVPKEITEGEKRVALVPEVVSKLNKHGFQVIVENGAGLEAGFPDAQYIAAGARIAEGAKEVYGSADIILKVQKPSDHPKYKEYEVSLAREGSLWISLLHPLFYKDIAGKFAAKKVDAIAMDMIPRTTLAQKMDALSSQANISGYKAVIMAANEIGKIFPLMMTAAGTVKPAKVLIMGAGVAGLQALGTAKRLGAVVEVSDIRPQSKEEVHSLGGRFLEVETTAEMQDERGYAKEASPEFLQKQKELIFKHATEADIIITTALVPGKKAPTLITGEMVKNMRKGSVILDMAVEFGGNCELSEPGKIVEKFGVKIIGEMNLPSLVATHASELYARNLLNLLEHISKQGTITINPDDEIVKGCLVAYKGEIVNDRIKALN
jgi:NAD(P) transhydrogenase subunit alpha